MQTNARIGRKWFQQRIVRRTSHQGHVHATHAEHVGDVGGGTAEAFFAADEVTGDVANHQDRGGLAHEALTPVACYLAGTH